MTIGRKGRSEPPASSLGILDVPSKPGKAVVTLTNLQVRDTAHTNCCTDSLYNFANSFLNLIQESIQSSRGC